jgi:transposase
MVSLANMQHNFRDKQWLETKYIKEKLSSFEIGRLENVSNVTIIVWLNKFNIKTRTLTEAKLSKRGVEKYKNKEWLQQKYITEHLSTYDISKISSISAGTVIKWLRAFQIPVRTFSESRRGLLAGKKHPQWDGGKTRLQEQIRKCYKYKEWRIAIYLRDNRTCQMCNKSGKICLNADHIVPFSILLKIHKIDSVKKAIGCQELWAISNGRTLCRQCHKQTDTYGYKAKEYKILL